MQIRTEEGGGLFCCFVFKKCLDAILVVGKEFEFSRTDMDICFYIHNYTSNLNLKQTHPCMIPAVSGPKEPKSGCFTFLKLLWNKMGAMLLLKISFLTYMGEPLLCHCDYAY